MRVAIRDYRDSMKLKQAIALILCLVVCCSFITFEVRASTSAQASLSSFGSVSLSQTPTSFAFGNEAIGTYLDTNDPNAQSISYFTSAVTQSVTDIVAYIRGVSSGKAMVALYAVNGNSVGALLEQSSSVNIGTTFSWVDFQLPTSCSVIVGTTYGLAIMGNVSVNIMIVTGTGQRTAGPGTGSYAKGFSNPFGAIWGADNTGAMSIYATGKSLPTSTQTPSPTPTPISTSTPSSANFEPLSAFYADMKGAASSYASLSSTVTHNGNPSIRVGPDSIRGTREVDGAWIRIHPGDHIVMSVWVKTDACPSSNDPQGGACFGWDFETTASSAAPGSLAIVDVSSDGTQAGHPTSAERGWGVGSFGLSVNGAAGLSQVSGNVVRVPWGTDWTLVVWDFIVPSTFYSYVTTGASFPYAMPCSPVQIDTMVPWFEGRNLYDNAYAYFSEPSLYINP